MIGTEAQDAVAEAMENQFTSASTNAVPAFFYHLGDVIYYNGQSSLYDSQFYEPYKYHPAVIFAIPGSTITNEMNPGTSGAAP